MVCSAGLLIIKVFGGGGGGGGWCYLVLGTDGSVGTRLEGEGNVMCRS